MSEEVWRDIAIGAMGILEIVIIAVIRNYFTQLDKRMDKQDEILKKVDHEQTTIKLTQTNHSVRIEHLESYKYRQ